MSPAKMTQLIEMPLGADFGGRIETWGWDLHAKWQFRGLSVTLF